MLPDIPRPQLEQGLRAAALRELLSQGIKDEGVMVIAGRRQPEASLQQDVEVRRRLEVPAPHHMGDLLDRIVHHDREVIARRRILAHHDRVAPLPGPGVDEAVLRLRA